MTAATDVRRSETTASVHLQWRDGRGRKRAVFSKHESGSLVLELVVEEGSCFARWGPDPTPTLELLPDPVLDALGDADVAE